MSYADSIVGKTIEGIDVSEDERALRFRVADGEPIVWDTEGDCCSESWWADGFQLDALRGQQVVQVKELDLPEPSDGRTRQEYDVAYGMSLLTERGEAKLVFRNSSNGYYGGWACETTDRPGLDWREITGNDWQA